MGVNKVIYNTKNGMKTLVDLTNDTVTPETLAEGKTAHDAKGNVITGTMSLVIPNQLYGKKVSLLGDSICAGSDKTYLGGYGKIIADRNNMDYQNLAVGGATITAETYSSSTGVAKNWLCRMVDDMDDSADYAIVEGGINDAWQYLDHNNIAIGEITEGYNATLDDTTYYGAFESMLKQLVLKFAGKKIGYIAVPKIMPAYDSEQNVPNFYHIALECCAKWGVPVCDLNTITPPVSYINELKNIYTPDGTHPSYEGYLKYYCDPIEEWMKTLTVGGNNSASIARKAVKEYTKGFDDAIEALQKGKLDNKGISFKKARLTLVDGTILEIDVLTATDGTVISPYTNQVPISIDTDGNILNGVGYGVGQRLSSSGVLKECSDSVYTGFIPAKSGDIIRIYNSEWATTTSSANYICAYDSSFNFVCGVATVQGSTSLTSYPSTGVNCYSDYSFDENGNVLSIKLNSNNIAYIRVNSAGFVAYDNTTPNGSEMIITINEEINNQ